MPKPKLTGLASIPEMIRVADVAAKWRVSPRTLIAAWRRQRGSPRLVRLKQGDYLVRADQVNDWLESRSVLSAEDLDSVIASIRLAGVRAAAEQPRGRARRGRQGTSASS